MGYNIIGIYQWVVIIIDSATCTCRLIGEAINSIFGGIFSCYVRLDSGKSWEVSTIEFH